MDDWKRHGHFPLRTQTKSDSAEGSPHDVFFMCLIYKYKHAERRAAMQIRVIISVSDFFSRISCYVHSVKS